MVAQGDLAGRITGPSKRPRPPQVHGSRPQAVQVDGGLPRVRPPVHLADVHPLDRAEEGQVRTRRS